MNQGGKGWEQFPPQILADQLTLSQPAGTDYAHLITTGTPGFSDLPTALIRISEEMDGILHEITFFEIMK